MQFTILLFWNRKIMALYRHLQMGNGKVVRVHTVKAFGVEV
jgi:hypothetical protein